VSFFDHIRRCTRHEPAKFRPWLIEGRIAGYLPLAAAEQLSRLRPLFVPDAAGRLGLMPDRYESRSQALAEAAAALKAMGLVKRLTGEMYPVETGGKALAEVDRGAVPALGVRAFGVHVNGVVEREDGLHLWIGHRSPSKETFPNELDNIVAGGQPAHLSLAENVVKECGEEASIPADLARRARPVGAISYAMDTEPAMVDQGIRRDVLFCYDLDLPADFTPKPNDGEIARYRLVPFAEAARIVETGFDYKFNCALVVIDLLIRRGWLKPDHPDYLAIVRGLRSDTL
jgi:8-oxo-dGTP pyrophosphatase MutT (NUDIX family)